MIDCIIIEDNINTITMLKSIIKDNFDTVLVKGNASSVVDGIKLIKTVNPEFILLDVNLDDGEGFEILKAFPKPNFKIIFITSYSKYAIEAFKFSALDFVLKPFSPEEICNAINKVITEKDKNHIQKLTTFQHNQVSLDKKLVLSNIDNVYIVNLEDILYAKSDNSYTTFFTLDQGEILVSKSLKSFDAKLSPYLFFRTHQKYLINLNHIKRFNKRSNEVVLLNNHILPVSKGKKEQLMSFLKTL